jgi:hypothetical protein
MTNLPITHMTLYKHGVGFFERRAQLEGKEITLSFRVEEMNDILKSLTAIDWGDGQVLTVEYATPQTREERLAGCSVRLADTRSLQDLLVALRGRRIVLLLDQQETYQGTLLGLDDVSQEQPLATALVSLLVDDTDQVQAVQLGRVQSVEILDERGAADLRFFLETALTQEDYRQVTIRLTPGPHDLSVSYVASAPTWRVSYRLVADSGGDAAEPQALLQGWGIFDNRLEEDLEAISLSLVAGMPISFVYDLYTPFTPERPVVEEEARVAAAPVEFDQAVAKAAPLEVMRDFAAVREPAALGVGMAMAAAAPRRVPREMLEKAVAVETAGEDLGELFQYVITTPVTVRRGQSAMVPIVSSTLVHRKDLLYNGSKMPNHPVATLRLRNETGLTLERGPVTVLENGQYVGEALLPFTPAAGEIVVPYAVELGAKVREESGARREIHGLSIKGHYLHVEEWDIRWRDVQINNATSEALLVLVEHPRTARYALFETVQPREKTEEHYRFQVEVVANGETTLRVQEHRLLRRREELQKVSSRTLQGYMKQGLLSRRDQSAVSDLLALWEKIAAHEQRVEAIGKEQTKIYKAQDQIQGNMKALAKTGKEGALRASYVDKLQESEEQLQRLAREEATLQAEIKKLNEQIARRIEGLG